MRIIKFLCNICLVFISFLIPKSKKYAVVGGWQGHRYADNSKAMFEYLSKHKEELGLKRVFFFTKEIDIARNIEDCGYEALLGANIRSIFWHFRSKYHFIDQNTHDILCWFSIRSVRINLWHGVPLKRIGYLIPGTPKDKQSWLDKYCFAGFWKDCYILATSEFAGKLLCESMRLPLSKCIVASYPRNEKLYHLKDNNHGEYILFYLPTFRETKVINPLLKYDGNKLGEFLVKHNAKLMIKPHFVDFEDWEVLKSIPNISIIDSKLDVYDLLHKADVLITDYSSVYFDYMISKRPIIFFPYDYQSYLQNERGFNMSYDEFTPGDKAITVDELLNVIEYVLERKTDYEEKWLNDYNRINSTVNKFTTEPNYKELIALFK